VYQCVACFIPIAVDKLSCWPLLACYPFFGQLLGQPLRDMSYTAFFKKKNPSLLNDEAFRLGIERQRNQIIEAGLKQLI